MKPLNFWGAGSHALGSSFLLNPDFFRLGRRGMTFLPLSMQPRFFSGRAGVVRIIPAQSGRQPNRYPTGRGHSWDRNWWDSPGLRDHLQAEFPPLWGHSLCTHPLWWTESGVELSFIPTGLAHILSIYQGHYQSPNLSPCFHPCFPAVHSKQSSQCEPFKIGCRSIAPSPPKLSCHLKFWVQTTALEIDITWSLFFSLLPLCLCHPQLPRPSCCCLEESSMLLPLDSSIYYASVGSYHISTRFSAKSSLRRATLTTLSKIAHSAVL